MNWMARELAHKVISMEIGSRESKEDVCYDHVLDIHSQVIVCECSKAVECRRG